MIRLITGLPGHNKTSNILALFLGEKGKRPLFATHIEGFDYDKHAVGRLENLEGIFDLPPNSLILCDEAQKFMRAREKTAAIPGWITNFETHRHLGIDLWITTQHPMLIDVHVRRLTEEHWHYFRPFGIQAAATVRKWTGRQDDPTDYHAIQQAEISTAKPPAWIFDEYKSTSIDTNKARFPKKLIYAGVAVLLAVAFIGWQVSRLRHPAVEAPLAPLAAPGLISAPATASRFGAGGDHKIGLDDFKPVSELAPWTAPVYAPAVKIVSAPRFAGCFASKRGCDCVTQQGTYLAVDLNICVSVVYGKAMPFNPMKSDSPDFQTSQSSPIPDRPSVVSHVESVRLATGN